MRRVIELIVIIALCVHVSLSQNVSQSISHQIEEDLGILTNDCIYMAGYALALKLSFVSDSTRINKIFYNSIHRHIYGLYMENGMKNSTQYYKFLFSLDQVNEQIQILAFNRSSENLYMKDQNNPNKTVKINKTNQNSSAQTQKNKQSNTRPPSNTKPQKTLSIESQQIDITKSHDKDIYFSSIHLTLKNNYKKYLSNCQIQHISYHIEIKDNFINVITYRIIYYERMVNKLYEFIVKIERNNLEIIKVPDWNASNQRNGLSFLLNNTFQSNKEQRKNQQRNNESILPVNQSNSNLNQSKNNLMPQNTSNVTINTSDTIIHQQNKSKMEIKDTINYRLIPQNIYAKQSRFKRLISIVYQMAKISSNSSLQSMEQWTYSLQVKILYKFLFKMLYQKPLENDSIGKLATIYVQEAKGNRIGIVNSSISQIFLLKDQEKNETVRQQQNNTMGNQSSNSLDQGEEEQNVIKKSVNQLSSAIISYSPFLQSYNIHFEHESLDNLQKNDTTIKKYESLVTFNKDNQSLCYNIHFSIINASIYQRLINLRIQNGQNVIINQYQLIQCQQSQSQNNYTSNYTFEFKSSDISAKIKHLLESIHTNCSITIEGSQRFQSFQRIKYSTCKGQVFQVIINEVTIIYYKRMMQQMYPSKGDSHNGKTKAFMQTKIAEYLNISKDKIQIMTSDILFQVNTSKILKINGKICLYKRFLPEILSYFTIFASYQQKASILKIQNYTKMADKPHQFFSINFTGKESWKQISYSQRHSHFNGMINLLFKNYSSLLSNTKILGIYEPIPLVQDKNVTQETVLQYKLIAKRIVNPYFFVYFEILVHYTQNQSSLIESIKALDKDRIEINDCVKIQKNYNYAEQCSQCYDGFRLINGVCFPQIQNCKEYHRQICISCQINPFQSHLSYSCPQNSHIQVQKMINTYRKIILAKK